MRQSFVPKLFEPPQTKELSDDYYVVPIKVKDVNEDWKIITTNVNSIFLTRGAGSRQEWPFNCSLEENRRDLSWLEECANYKQLFSYIIRRKTDDVYIGCIYIYPIELHFADKADVYDVDFSFWIIQSEFDEGKYDKIFDLLIDWLKKDWPFQIERVFLRNKLLPKKYQKMNR